jgi:hypothetical protein
MEFLFFLLVVVGLGIGTAALAKRYNREPLGWGIFGALLFVIALPVLLLKGPRSGAGISVVQRSAASGPHLPRSSNPAHWSTAQRRVVEVLNDVGVAGFDLLAARTGLDEDALEEAINVMLDGDDLNATSDGFILSARLQRRELPAAPTAAHERARPAATATSDPAERLRRLAELHAEGLVADDEYAAKRKTILDEL